MDTLFNLQEERMRDIIKENEKFIKDSVEISIKSLKEDKKKRKKIKKCKKYSKNTDNTYNNNNFEYEKSENKK